MYRFLYFVIKLIFVNLFYYECLDLRWLFIENLFLLGLIL